MLTAPNILSLFRFPLALLFLNSNVIVRFSAIIIAMISDGLDGYLARRTRSASQLGAMLDPLADKFFMIFALCVLLMENRITAGELCALLSRDIAVAIFALYLGITGGWATYKLRPFWCGKVSTALQFCVLIALTSNAFVLIHIYAIFVTLGILALGELAFIHKKSTSNA